jgi:hypothetical protein
MTRKIQCVIFLSLLVFLLLLLVQPMPVMGQISNSDLPDPDSDVTTFDSDSDLPDPDSDVTTFDLDSDLPDPDSDILSSSSKSPFSVLSSTSSHGKSHPVSGLVVSTSVNKTKINRSECINISINISSKDATSERIELILHKPKYLDYIEIRNLSDNCVISLNETNKKIITCDRLKKNEFAYAEILSRVSLNASTGTRSLAKDLINRLSWTYRRGDPAINNLSIIISNNKPVLSYAKIEVLTPCEFVKSKNALILSNFDKNIYIKFMTSANDVEDSRVRYNFILNNFEHNYTYLSSNGPLEKIVPLSDLKSNTYYTITLCVADNDSDISYWNGPVELVNGDHSAKYIYFIDWKSAWDLYRYAIVYLAFGLLTVTLLAIALIYISHKFVRINKYNINIFRSIKLIDLIFISIIILATMIYLYLFSTGDDANLLGSQFGLFKSLPFFLFYIYIVILFLFFYLTERFFEVLEEKHHLFLLVINAFSMMVLLWSIALIMSRIDPMSVDSHMRSYYASLSGIFATVLAIMAAFYTNMPKNIININSSNNVDISYPYPAMIHRLVIVYGLIVAFSLWGLSSGVSINFNPIISLDLYNFICIFIFAATIMLIPPAITCFYKLLSLIIFRSSICIESEPNGATIYIDNHLTKLTTPATLILNRPDSGCYEIRLEKENYTCDKLDPIEVTVGTQRKYCYELKPVKSSNHNSSTQMNNENKNKTNEKNSHF